MRYFSLSLLFAFLSFLPVLPSQAASRPLRVVTTLPDYADLTRRIAGDRAEVFALVLGNQDAHFIRPKPSFVRRVGTADLLVSTGLDLELWLPTIVNGSGNTHVRSGQPGFVAAAVGVPMLEVPKVLSRSEGGLHIYGNPHVTPSPINMKIAARNITNGLIKNDPEGRDLYEGRLKELMHEFDVRLFGAKLTEQFGGEVLCRLAEQGKLLPFLEKQQHLGRPLIENLGGWLGAMRPVAGSPVVTYHKNWAYFLKLFSLVEAGTVEPKPGIPPTARHRVELLQTMKSQRVKVILAANYFNQGLSTSLASQVGAKAVIVPLFVGGAPGTDSYFALVDHWIESLRTALEVSP